ncbi:hypothetical protein KY366_03595 [Candidatus Woesearchaeota archaeon]|nr:hypothetical protein [Candidatus Woesearchaeota archaeon]
MSRAIVMIIKRVAKPRGLANVNPGSAELTARPVTEGFENAKLRRKRAETMFSMNR